MEGMDSTRMGRQQKMLEFEDELRELKERIPQSTAEADYNYMRYIKDDAKRVKEEEDNYLSMAKDDPNRTRAFLYRNYYADVMNYVTPRIGNQFSEFNGFACNHQELIDRCFYSNSVEEIMENLRKENSPFALECLDAMKHNSK